MRRFSPKNMKRALLVALAICLGVTINPFGVKSLHASSKGDDIRTLQEEVASLRKDMDEIKRVLISVLPALVNGNGVGAPGALAGVPQAVPGGPRPQELKSVTVSIGESPSQGSDAATVAIIEFSDYECPFCSKFHSEAYEDIKKDFVDTGKILFVHKDLPLPFHKNAEPAALASRCAGDQGMYWEMNHALYVNSGDLANLEKIAESTGLKMPSFRKCMKEKSHRAGIASDLDEGRSAGVRGTPTFVIGKIVNGQVSGEVIPGAAPYAMFREKLNNIIAEGGQIARD